MHVVNTHSHALRYTALHYSCSVLYVCMYASRRAVARVYVCALHRKECECGVQQLSRVMSFLYGALQGVTLAEDTCLPALRA